MTDKLSHRGPDGAGYEIITEGSFVVGLGHRRLSIIDLSDNAKQPMTSRDANTTVVFNGELYNYTELRHSFGQHNTWVSDSDTEVLVELWNQGGAESMKAALGMYAFAAYDRHHRRLWLVRDRLGKKPLYWAFARDGGIRFASEIPSLLEDGAISRQTTPDRIAEFLQHGFICGARTGFSSVHQVPAASAMEFWVEGGIVRVKEHKYWQLPSHQAGSSYENWLKEFEETLEDAVRIRLRSDVPVGAFLSGGVDSSVVALLAARLYGTSLSTFVADFHDSAHSEARWAAEVAQQIGSNHQTLMVHPDADLLASRVVSVYGDLFGDPSAIPTMDICKEMRRHVKVALSGDGGDELLGGYSRYGAAIESHDRFSASAFSVAAAKHLRRVLPTWMRGTSRLAHINATLDETYASLFKAFPTRLIPPLMQQDMMWEDPILQALRRNREKPALHKMMWADLETYLPSDNFVKVDRASMSVGLEVRSPLVDHRLVELVATARPEWLSSGGPKRPLRDLYARQLPSAVFTRKKMGFAPPTGHWMVAMGATAILERINGSGLMQVLDRRQVEREVRSFTSGLHGSFSRLWFLLVAAEWWNTWRPELIAATHHPDSERVA